MRMQALERLSVVVMVLSVSVSAWALSNWISLSCGKTTLANGEPTNLTVGGESVGNGKLVLWNVKRMFALEERAVVPGRFSQVFTARMGLPEDVLSGEQLQARLFDSTGRNVSNSTAPWFKSNPLPPAGWSVYNCGTYYSGSLKTPTLALTNGKTSVSVECLYTKPANEGGNDVAIPLIAGNPKAVPLGGQTRTLTTGTNGKFTFTVHKDWVQNGTLIFVHVFKDNGLYVTVTGNMLKVAK